MSTLTREDARAAELILTLERRMQDADLARAERNAAHAKIDSQVEYTNGVLELRSSGHVLLRTGVVEPTLLGHVSYALAGSRVARFYQEFMSK